MGEYIRRGNHEIKIGVLDELWLTRKELCRLKTEGYLGYYAGKYNGEIDGHLQNENTLFLSSFYDSYLLEDRRKAILENNLYRIQRPLQVFFEREFLTNAIHHFVYVWKTGTYGNGYQYKLPCHYDINCTNLNPDSKKDRFCAVIVGERFSKGKARTIFACDCCGSLFSIGKEDLLRIQAVQEVIKPFIFTRED